LQFGFGLKTICEPRHHWRPRFDDAVAEMREQSRIVFELGEVDRYFDSGANLVVAQPKSAPARADDRARTTRDLDQLQRVK
jgi:hypothetical protein